jgi:hypothetical protein
VTITIDIDPATIDAEGLDWLRQLIAHHPDAIVDAAPAPLLGHVLDTFGPDDRLAAATICERLAAAHPDRYAGWYPGVLARHLARHGINSELVAVPTNRRGFRTTELRRGYRRDDLEAAR